MPTVTLRIPAELLDQDAKDRLAADITQACAEAESIPDEPARRIGTWVLIDEIPAGSWYAGGGRDALAAFIPAVAIVHPPEGVLDEARRGVMIRGISAAVDRAFADEGRQAQTSIMLLDVPEGHWGVREQVIGLKEHANLWGYAHLQHL